MRRNYRYLLLFLKFLIEDGERRLQTFYTGIPDADAMIFFSVNDLCQMSTPGNKGEGGEGVKNTQNTVNAVYKR